MTEHGKKTALVILGIIGIGVMLDVSGVTARLWDKVFSPRRMFYESDDQFWARRLSSMAERARKAVAPTPDSATWTDPVSGMEFVFVPGGCFQMGQTEADKAQLIKEVGEENYASWFADELPRHEVCVKGFWMGKYEVTQAQWQAIMESNPSNFKGADRPVETVSWNDAQEFLKKLNAAWANSRSPAQFRLPSEAEWEYAARAGTQTAYSFGDDPNQLGEYAWFVDNSGNNTHPVGQLKPNAFGLYDMHGNVWEWVADTYHENYNDAPTDGSVWEDLGDRKAKVLRGGSWNSSPRSCRSAYRNWNAPDYRYYNFGARVVVGAR